MLRRTLQRLDPDIITPTDADVAVGMTWLVRNGIGIQVMETRALSSVARVRMATEFPFFLLRRKPD